MPRLYHPILDRTVVRTEKQARVLRRSGWQDLTTDDEANFFLAGSGVESDVGGETPAVQEPTPDNEPED